MMASSNGDVDPAIAASTNMNRSISSYRSNENSSSVSSGSRSSRGIDKRRGSPTDSDRKPLTPSLKNEFKFDGGVKREEGSYPTPRLLSRSLAASQTSQTSSAKYLNNFNSKELGLVYNEESLIEEFSEWNHGKGSFYVSNSFHIFFQDYRLIVRCCLTTDSYLIDDDVYSVFINYFEDVAVAVSQNIVHFISPRYSEGGDNNNGDNNGDDGEEEGNLTIRSIYFEYQPRSTDLCLVYSDLYSIFCISSGSCITLYFYHKTKCECVRLAELDLTTCEYFKFKYFDIMKNTLDGLNLAAAAHIKEEEEKVKENGKEEEEEPEKTKEELIEMVKKGEMSQEQIQAYINERFKIKEEKWIRGAEKRFAEESIANVSELLKSIPTVIKKLAFWIVDGSVYLFVSGDDNWISICRVHAGSEFDEQDNLNNISYLLTDISTHQGCISAFSEPSYEDIFTSGDSKGSIAIWGFRKRQTNRGGIDDKSTSQQLDDAECPSILCIQKSLSEFPIISVLIDGNNGMHGKVVYNYNIWAGDEAGAVLGLAYNSIAMKLTYVRKVVPSFSSIPRQLFTFDRSSNAVKRSVLRTVDSFTGAMTDCVLYDTSSTLFRSHLDCPPRGRGPWNLVDNACILPNLQILMTYGSDKSMFVWDIFSCQLITIIPMSDQLAISSVCVDRDQPLDCAVDAGTDIKVKIYTGHQRGSIHEYDLILGYEDFSKPVVEGEDAPDRTTATAAAAVTSTTTATIVAGDDSSVSREGANGLSFTNRAGIVDGTSTTSAQGFEISKKVGGLDIFEQLEGGIQADLQNIEMQSMLSHAASNVFFEDLDGHGQQRLQSNDDSSGLPANNSFKLRYQRLDKGKCLELSALPVTDLHLSKSGNVMSACFAKRVLMIYSLDKSTLLRMIDFENPIADVSRVLFSDHLRSKDDLCLVLQEAQTTKLLDAVTGKKLTQFQLDLFGMDIYCSVLWELSISNNNDINNSSNISNDSKNSSGGNSNSRGETANSSSSNRSLAGICVTKGLGVFLFSEATGCSRLLIPDCSSAEFDSPLNSLVLGCEAFELGESPMVCIWTLRRLIVLRINLGLDGSDYMCMKMVDYTVPDTYVRIIRAKSLYTDKIMRNHRVLVILSDGSTCILNI